jgi:hypothetical protein
VPRGSIVTESVIKSKKSSCRFMGCLIISLRKRASRRAGTRLNRGQFSASY